MAIVAVLAAMWPRTALPMPTPPTSRADSPTKRQEHRHPVDQPLQIGRGLAKGAQLASRHRERRCAPRLSMRPTFARPAGAADNDRSPARRAGSARFRRSAAAEIMTRGPKIRPLAAASGSRAIVPRICRTRLADLDPVADLDPEPAEQRRVDDRAENAYPGAPAPRRDLAPATA